MIDNERDQRIKNAIQKVRSCMNPCRLCPRNCGVNRFAGEKGFCGVGYPSGIFYNNILYGEEIEICPTYELFFSGCNMRCSYCYVREWVVNPENKSREDVFAVLGKLKNLKETYKSISFIGG